MSKRRGQCCEPLTLLGTTFYCVEPVDHQCKHYFHFLESDVRRIAERATQAEADAAALRADIARHVAIAAEQATEIEALRSLLRDGYQSACFTTGDDINRVALHYASREQAERAFNTIADFIDADTARALGEGR